MSMCKMVLVMVLGLLAAPVVPAAPAAAAEFKVEKGDGQITVKLGDELFTNYVYQGHSKPILYPVMGPGGVPMTRNYPMKKDVKGEASDHPHHKSLWYNHGNVNGVDFWLEYDREGKPAENAGHIIHKETLEARGGKTAVIKTRNEWVAPGNKTVLTDVRTMTFHNLAGGRAIDFEITLTASHGDVTFGETKEGTMGIRTHPQLRLKADPKRGVESVSGKAINSEGVEGAAIWGKRAKWVDYWGTVDGKMVGVAIFDHPSNPRHPTYWHARDYGLVAANPFGIHDFDKTQPEKSGDMKLKNGDSVTFKYRFYFHEGDHAKANIPQAYQQWATTSAE